MRKDLCAIVVFIDVAHKRNKFVFADAEGSCVRDLARKPILKTSKTKFLGRDRIRALPHEATLARRRLDKTVGFQLFVSDLYRYDAYAQLARDETNGR